MELDPYKGLGRQKRNAYIQSPFLGGCKGPFTIKGDNPVVVPCRKCGPCLRKKRERLVGKIAAEALLHDFGQFITYTYDDEHLPLFPDQDLVEAEWHRLRKRLERRLGKFKHCTVAQISPGGRLHFHQCVMSSTGELPEPSGFRTTILADKLWPYGHRDVRELTSRKAQYVAEYISRSGSKGTVKVWKTNKLGEDYFNFYLQKQSWKRYPKHMIPSGCYFIPQEHGLVQWFPACDKWRNQLIEAGCEWGYDPPPPLGKWLRENGLAKSNVESLENLNQLEKRDREFKPEREHFLATEIKEAKKWR